MRLEPTLIELEREQEDLLIISHASVIRCLLAYLIGLPASEIPAIEIARGDLLEARTSFRIPYHDLCRLVLCYRWYRHLTVSIAERFTSGMALDVEAMVTWTLGGMERKATQDKTFMKILLKIRNIALDRERERQRR